MEWIKKNGALTLGVGLPLLLVVFFALAAWLPSLFVEPPKYDVLYLSSYDHYSNNNRLRYEVQNQQLTFKFVGENHGYNWPKLYRYSPATGAVREITIPIPDELPVIPYEQRHKKTEPRVTSVEVPEVANLVVDTSSIAPDGYEFRVGRDGSAGLLNEIFYSSRNRHSARLVKNGNIIKVPTMSSNYYNSAAFIGWVMP